MIPNDKEKRQRLLSMIKEAVEEKLIIDSANIHLSDIRKNVKEEFELSPKQFNNLVKAFIDDEHIRKLFSEVEETFHDFEILNALDR